MVGGQAAGNLAVRGIAARNARGNGARMPPAGGEMVKTPAQGWTGSWACAQRLKILIIFAGQRPALSLVGNPAGTTSNTEKR